MFSLFAQKDNGFARFFISHPVFLNSRKAVAHLVGIIRAFSAQVNIGGANIGVVVYGKLFFTNLPCRFWLDIPSFSASLDLLMCLS